MHGRSMTHKSVTAKTPYEIANHGKRTNLLHVMIEFIPGEVPIISEVDKQGSHMLSSITHADGYISLEPEETLEPGILKEVFLF